MPVQTPFWGEILTCTICFQKYDGNQRSPINLGCGHTLCKGCLTHLNPRQCPFDQNRITLTPENFVVNYALLKLSGLPVPDKPNHPPIIQALPQADQDHYDEILEDVQVLGNILQYAPVLSSNEHYSKLSKPMQRKLVNLLQCTLLDEEGRGKTFRTIRSVSERAMNEIILQHQNPHQLSANLWAAVRARGCQFLGPAIQEEVLKLVILALEDGSPLSRKVLVMFVVQRLEARFPQASKTSVGHVVQLLYRASCFTVSKQETDSSLMQLKEEFRTYENLRREHDSQIVQIATEAGLRIGPDQWSSLLYGDQSHKSHMQSVIDRLQTPQSFAQSALELVISLQRCGELKSAEDLGPRLQFLGNIDPSADALPPTWQELAYATRSANHLVNELINLLFSPGYAEKKQPSSQSPHSSKNNNDTEVLDSDLAARTSPARPSSHTSHTSHTSHSSHSQTPRNYKIRMCNTVTHGKTCRRGAGCYFAHTEDELETFRGKHNAKLLTDRATNTVNNNNSAGGSGGGGGSSSTSSETSNNNNGSDSKSNKRSNNLPSTSKPSEKANVGGGNKGHKTLKSTPRTPTSTSKVSASTSTITYSKPSTSGRSANTAATTSTAQQTKNPSTGNKPVINSASFTQSNSGQSHGSNRRRQPTHEEQVAFRNRMMEMNMRAPPPSRIPQQNPLVINTLNINNYHHLSPVQNSSAMNLLNVNTSCHLSPGQNNYVPQLNVNIHHVPASPTLNPNIPVTVNTLSHGFVRSDSILAQDSDSVPYEAQRSGSFGPISRREYWRHMEQQASPGASSPTGYLSINIPQQIPFNMNAGFHGRNVHCGDVQQFRLLQVVTPGCAQAPMPPPQLPIIFQPPGPPFMPPPNAPPIYGIVQSEVHQVQMANIPEDMNPAHGAIPRQFMDPNAAPIYGIVQSEVHQVQMANIPEDMNPAHGAIPRQFMDPNAAPIYGIVQSEVHQVQMANISEDMNPSHGAIPRQFMDPNAAPIYGIVQSEVHQVQMANIPEDMNPAHGAIPRQFMDPNAAPIYGIVQSEVHQVQMANIPEDMNPSHGAIPRQFMDPNAAPIYGIVQSEVHQVQMANIPEDMNPAHGAIPRQFMDPNAAPIYGIVQSEVHQVQMANIPEGMNPAQGAIPRQFMEPIIRGFVDNEDANEMNRNMVELESRWLTEIEEAERLWLREANNN